MSNIAGKAYAMNVVTPIRWQTLWLNKAYFFGVKYFPEKLNGLITLSLIHYARWVIVGRKQFPHVSNDQPRETLKYNYMLFFSNFNGSWDQYVDSFTFAIPAGLDLFWKWNVRYSKSVTLTPFHRYIQHNQLETLHYYNAYPLASSNDVKSAQHVREQLLAFNAQVNEGSDQEFQRRYNALLRALQHDLGAMYPTPIISMSAYQVEKRQRWHHGQLDQENSHAQRQR